MLNGIPEVVCSLWGPGFYPGKAQSSRDPPVGSLEMMASGATPTYSFVPGPCILSVVNTAHIEVFGLNIKLACHLYRVLSPYWCLGQASRPFQCLLLDGVVDDASLMGSHGHGLILHLLLCELGPLKG